jgi:hypothetical protein
MENIPFEAPLDRSKPLHPWYGDTEQFRLKLRTFSNAPPEFTVQRISFDRDVSAYNRAYENARGPEASVPPRRRSAPKNDEPRSTESIENSQRRSKSNVRLAVTELAPNHFTTFTTRETGPEYFTPVDWRSMWSAFVALVRMAGLDFEYVAVLERHPSNPEHLHLHVAWRGHAHYGQLRRLWHISIMKQKGERVYKTVRGEDSPGNIQDRPVKAPRGSFRQVRKIARYISKYITKDLICEFNKKRYWPSKGIDLAAAQVFWLDGLTQFDAVREACALLGQWDDGAGLTPQKLFMPSERVCWCAIDPALTPDPPF